MMAANKSPLQRLRQATGQMFVLRVFGVGLLFLMHASLGRSLGRESYGVLRFAMAIAAVLGVILPMGWPSASMRYIAQYSEQRSWPLLRGMLLQGARFTLFAAAASALALAALATAPWWKAGLPGSMLMAAALLPPVCFAFLRRKSFQGFQQIRASVIPDEIILPGLVILLIWGLGISRVGGAYTVYLGSHLLVWIGAQAWFFRQLPDEITDCKADYRSDEWWAVARPLMFSGMSRWILNRTDVLMLGFMSQLSWVGVYSAANQIAMLNTFVLKAANKLAAPMLGAAYHGGRRAEFLAVKRRVMLWSALSALPLFLAMVIWPRPLLRLFGPGFADGAMLLRILACGQLVNAVTGPVGYALIMSGREKDFSRSLGVAAGLNIAGNLALIPRFGAVGAALATAGSAVLLNVWQLWLCRADAIFATTPAAGSDAAGNDPLDKLDE